jgi:hypothetical protein
VGERAAEIRRRATEGLELLGVAIDQARNCGVGPDANLSAPGALVSTLVLRAREDLEIAPGARRSGGFERMSCGPAARLARCLKRRHQAARSDEAITARANQWFAGASAGAVGA